MKASEFIVKLQKAIEQHGDTTILEWSDGYLEYLTPLEIKREWTEDNRPYFDIDWSENESR